MSTSPSPGRTQLDRWIASGGHWSVVAERESELTVALLTCDGGEEMDRVVLGGDEISDLIGQTPPP